MNVNIDTNIKQFKRKLYRFEKKALPQALRHTVSDLAKELAMKEMRKVVNDTFQGGATRWTKQSFAYVKAKKGKRPVSKVFIKDNQAEYLQYQIDGGTRLPNGRFIAVPHHKTRKNKYGNLSQEKWAELVTNKKKFFAGTPKGAKRPTRGGIYERLGENGRDNYIMRAAFAPSAKYHKVFKYFETAQRFVQRRFEPVIWANLSKAIKRMK